MDGFKLGNLKIFFVAQIYLCIIYLCIIYLFIYFFIYLIGYLYIIEK